MGSSFVISKIVVFFECFMSKKAPIPFFSFNFDLVKSVFILTLHF